MRSPNWIREQLKSLENEIVRVILAGPSADELRALEGKLALRMRLANLLHRLEYDTRECLLAGR